MSQSQVEAGLLRAAAALVGAVAHVQQHGWEVGSGALVQALAEVRYWGIPVLRVCDPSGDRTEGILLSLETKQPV